MYNFRRNACEAAISARNQPEVSMSRYPHMIMGLLVSFVLFSANAASAQTYSYSPESLAAAKELIETIHLNDQIRAMLPATVKNLKPAIVQGRSEVDKQYETLAPIVIDSFQVRMSELLDAFAIVYARNFPTEDLLALVAFYKTPVGQRLLQKTPSVTQETMAVGAKFGQSVGGEVQQRMIEELRKRGVNL
jgi:uncharacterized protein